MRIIVKLPESDNQNFCNVVTIDRQENQSFTITLSYVTHVIDMN